MGVFHQSMCMRMNVRLLTLAALMGMLMMLIVKVPMAMALFFMGML